METIQTILSITSKHDEKLESIRREISEYEKELTFLRVKNESNPGKKWFWSLLEGIGWFFITVSVLFILCFAGDDPFSIVMLLVIEVPSLLLTLLFRHFKQMYLTKAHSMDVLSNKIAQLKQQLEQVNEEKRTLINQYNEAKPSTTAEKQCPMCAEMVKAQAQICRFCNHKFK